MTTATSDMDIKDLERMVNDTEARLKRFTEFSQDVAREVGKQTKYEEGSDYVRSAHTLNDFFGFDIETDGAMYRGSHVKIKHEGVPVLRLDHWNDENYTVHLYQSGPWEQKFEDMIKNKERLVSEYSKKTKTEAQLRIDAEQKQQQDALRREKLLEKAKKLKLL